MESGSNNPALVVIVGQTASGKTALALDLAKRFNGEVIAADSRTIYKGMDIGTAKPTVHQQQTVPHHLLDIAEPSQRFTVADFKRLANTAITDITRRGKLPILVGGSGLYIDAVLYNFVFRKNTGEFARRALEVLSVEELQSLLKERSIPLPVNSLNPRHLIRTLETNGAMSTKSPIRPRTMVLGIQVEPEDQKRRISNRLEQMIASGLVAEVEQLVKIYGWDAPALNAPGYKEFRQFLDGGVSLEETKERIVRSHCQYARRQKTWFKRNKDIHWISKTEEAVALFTT